MPTVPPEKIAEIRDRVDIERLIGRTVDLKRKGRSLMGCCPFHGEKTPSFSVDSVKKLYHCFGCGAGGDVFDFVMRQDGTDFPETLRTLARETGVQLPEREESPAEKSARKERKRMYRVNEIAREFYRDELTRNERAQAYLREDRGLTDSTIRDFGLGFAPEGWENLANVLNKRDVPVDLPLRLGLVGQSTRRNGVYDKFRGKVVFPIGLPGGDIAGFGARRADWLVKDQDDRGPKYLNSSESAVYDKSAIFYGLDRARDTIRRQKRAVLVEGYFDVIALHQAGVSVAVACCGTALSARHAAQLSRLLRDGGTVITLYDGDSAGRTASRRASEVLLGAGVPVKVLYLPKEDDPDTFVRREGGQALSAALDGAPSAIDAFLADAIDQHKGAGVYGTVQIVKSIGPLLVAMKDRDEARIWAEAVARKLGISPRELHRQLNAPTPADARRSAPRYEEPPPVGDLPRRPAPAAPPPPARELEVLRLLIDDPIPTFKKLEDSNAFEAFTHPAINAAVEAAANAQRSGHLFDVHRALEAVQASGAGDEATLSLIRKTLMRDLPEKYDLARCLEHLLRKHQKSRLANLTRQIAREDNPETVERLVAEAEAIRKASQTTGREI